MERRTKFKVECYASAGEKGKRQGISVEKKKTNKREDVWGKEPGLSTRKRKTEFTGFGAKGMPRGNALTGRRRDAVPEHKRKDPRVLKRVGEKKGGEAARVLGEDRDWAYSLGETTKLKETSPI